MEDCTMVCADCVVMCTCCPCLVIQFMGFILVRLPCKIARKTKKLVWKKIKAKSTGRSKKIFSRREECSELEQDTGGNLLICSDFQCPVDEVDKVMKELYECGEFGFGFFGRRRSKRYVDSGNGSCVWEIVCEIRAEEF